MASIRNAMLSHLTTLDASFKTMNEYPRDALLQATADIINAAGLTTPVVRTTPNGFVAAYRATAVKRSLITTIKRNDGVEWDTFKQTFEPQMGMLMSQQFNGDDQQTLTAIFGADYWKSYRAAFMDGMTTANTFENCVKGTWRCVLGDYTYWKTAANLYLEAMEAADTDLKRSIYAQKAKISHIHAEGIKTGFTHSFPTATLTEMWIEA